MSYSELYHLVCVCVCVCVVWAVVFRVHVVTLCVYDIKCTFVSYCMCFCVVLPMFTSARILSSKFITCTRSGAPFARPLLACACIPFVYLLHGGLLRSHSIA